MTPTQLLTFVQSPLRHVARGLRSSLGRAGPQLAADERGASAVLGTVLAFGLVISLLAMIQVSAVPAWNQQAEFDHLTKAEADFASLDESVVLAAEGRTSRSTIAGSVTYPTRAFFVSPTAGVGTLQMTDTQSASIDHAVATGETGTYWDGSTKSFDSQTFVYQPSYNTLEEPKLTHEGFAQYTAYANGNSTREVGATQNLIDGTTISLVLLKGDFSTGNSDATTVSVTPLSAGTDYITVTDDGTPITLSVPTHLSNETWHELLADEPNVQSITYTNGTDSNTVTVELKPGRTYDLHISRVGINSAGSAQEPAYIVDVVGDDAVVPAGATHRAVVEVRDEHNNPVANAVVRVDNSDVEGDVRARDGGMVTTTDANGRATLVYTAPDSISGIYGADGASGIEQDNFDVSVVDSDGNTVDSLAIDLELRQGTSVMSVRGLVAAVGDPGFAYDDVNNNRVFDGNDTKVVPTDGTYVASNGTLVVPPSVGTVVDDSVEFRGHGVSLHIDAVATGGDVTVDGQDGTVRAVGVSLTSASGDVVVDTNGDVDLTGAALSASSGGILVAGEEVDLDNAGVSSFATGAGTNRTVDIDASGFLSARNADLSGQKNIDITATDGVDFTGAGISAAQATTDVTITSTMGGADLIGLVAHVDGDFTMNVNGDVFLIGTNIASTKPNGDIELTTTTGKITGKEVSLSTDGDITLRTDDSYISLPRANLQGGSIGIYADTYVDLTDAAYPEDDTTIEPEDDA